MIKNKKWIILGSALIVAVIIIAVIVVYSRGITVETDTVENDQVVKLVKEVGTVESESTVIIAAKYNVEIKEIKVSEGDAVSSGDTLMTSDETSAELDIKSLKAQLSGLQVQYNQAKNIANKYKILYEQGVLGYEDYNKSNIAVKQLSAQISALNYSIQSYLETSGSLGVSAPIDGIITGVFVKEGESVSVGTQLFEISNLSDIYVKVDLITEDADLVKVGDKVRCYNKDTGFSDDSCTVKKVHIKAQEKLSDLGVKQKRVTVEIDFSKEPSIRLGSDVDVEIIVDQKDKTLRVSDRTIFEIEHQNCVYVIENGKAELREVEIGIEGEDYTEITAGLSQGEKVILSPNDDIKDGVKVKVE